MSDPNISSDQHICSTDISVESVFDVDGSIPDETPQTVQQYLSQETRHNILQLILGHPHHLVSVTEFDYYIPKSRSTISEQLADLADHEILTQYTHQPNAEVRDLPTDFWGFTEFGLRLIAEYNYLRGLPIMRAAHDATDKTEKVQRHEAAPRPTLPALIQSVLTFDETDQADPRVTADSCTEFHTQTLYADAAPADPSVLNADADGDRTLEELF
ncbi:hypothetical protein [Halohasta litorea]|uniref:ArsR family transcriptional regulator n=1 Tax=Halohasta litorea TaxID=869891 RepID=A0ABD6D5E3_9EURY|nr:hypothetical protein [Halohasta litorea]